MNNSYQYKPIVYFSFTFLITFVLWFIGAYLSHQARDGLYTIFMLIGLLTPFIISLFMIIRSKNTELRKDFVNRLFNLKLIRPSIGLTLFYFLIMPITVVISIAISLLFGGSVSQFNFADGFSFSIGSVPILLVLFLAASFEELGWRGYAFDSLQSRNSFFKASIIFSILWSLWHLPLIFVKESYQYELLGQNPWYAVNFFVSIVPMGLIISWICVKNRKSVIAAIFFHFIINISQEALAMTQTTKCIETVVLIAIASIIVVLDKDMFFSREHLINVNNKE
ncbi:MAG TPA: CPBP family intramembrane metalloprotease [Trueperaceae bacterium]|nr:CPBP family intramembrane metalloprotease [Trueperaceae bacterium]